MLCFSIAVQMPIQCQHSMHVQFVHSFHNLFIMPIETHCTQFCLYSWGGLSYIYCGSCAWPSSPKYTFCILNFHQEHHVLVMLYFWSVLHVFWQFRRKRQFVFPVCHRSLCNADSAC
jgi:hypothetical protein